MGTTFETAQQVTDPEPGHGGSPGARWLLAVGVLLLLVISWHPFELEVPAVGSGDIETREDGSLRVANGGFASTSQPPSWLPRAIRHEAMLLSMRVRPNDDGQDGPARILALSAPPAGAAEDQVRHNLVIGQSGTDLVVRVVRPGSDRQGRPDIVVPGVLTPHEWHDIELELDEELRLTVDGKLEVLEPGTAGWSAAWAQDHRLSVGNTLSGTRMWDGTIARARVVIGSQQIDLLASEELDRREAGPHIAPRLTEALSREGADAMTVGMLHVLIGFLLGAAVATTRSARPPVDSLWVVPALAAVANLGKVVIATRHPSIATFLLQAGGSGLGVIAAVAAARRRHPAVRLR